MNTARVTRIGRATRELALSAGAVLGVLCLVLTAAGLTMGLHPLVFRSGSMGPTIDTGDLALSRSVAASELGRGDIVSVLDSRGTRVTHRVVNVAEEGELRQLTLQGDANDQPDAEIYTVREAQRVLFHVPRLGYVVGWLTGPVGLFILGLYAALLLSVILRRERPGADASPPAPARHTGPRRRAAPEHRRRLPAVLSAAVAAVAVTVVGVAAVLLPAPVWAAPWTNGLGASGTYSATTVPAPATFTCGVLGLLSVTFDWSAVAGATDYTVHYGSGGSITRTVAGTSTTIVSAISDGTAWVQANVNYGSTTWTSGASVSRTYTVAVVSVCS